MRNAFRRYSVLLASFLATGFIQAATNSASGLWVGEVTLQKVNETVSGVNAANQVISRDPNVATPVSSAAHLRIIFHVDTNGLVRLLKGVAIVDKSTNGTPDIALISNPALYSQFGNRPGQRITAVAYDFGDGPAAQDALDAIAAAAGAAAASGGNAANAANAKVNFYQTNVLAGATAAYLAFVQTTNFSGAASKSAVNATSGLNGVSASESLARRTDIATLAAVNALKDAGVYAAADALVLNELPMAGSLAPGNALTNTIYLGADHPTNPFRHKWSPSHRHGYAVTRALDIHFDSASSSNALAQIGFGVDRISGTYRESILGLHKPLGPNQDIGLITEGVIHLEHISTVDTLNQ